MTAHTVRFFPDNWARLEGSSRTNPFSEPCIVLPVPPVLERIIILASAVAVPFPGYLLAEGGPNLQSSCIWIDEPRIALRWLPPPSGQGRCDSSTPDQLPMLLKTGIPSLPLGSVCSLLLVASSPLVFHSTLFFCRAHLLQRLPRHSPCTYWLLFVNTTCPFVPAFVPCLYTPPDLLRCLLFLDSFFYELVSCVKSMSVRMILLTCHSVYSC